MIRTKIIATLGPASHDAQTISALVKAGCDVFRINFSHGSDEDHGLVLQNIRQVEQEHRTPLAVIADLCGPKIRVGQIAGGSVILTQNATIAIQRDPVEGTAERISTTLPELVDHVRVGARLLLDDGKIVLEVVQASPGRDLVCRVANGGPLSSGKGVNLPRTQLAMSALTVKDRADVTWIAQRPFDYVALSFVRSPDDVVELRHLLDSCGSTAQVIAKIEKPQALEHIESIIDAADGIMVARGDLGVEMDLPAVPVAQKRIARLCQTAAKPCIIATQMLESMIGSATPTRAEVSDVANAVLDQADAVMLSGETAIGQYPVQAVEMMNRVVQAIESYHDQTCAVAPVQATGAEVPAAIASAVREMLAHLDIAAVAVFTISGATARLLSKSRLSRPIVAMSPDVASVRRMCLYYGVAAAYQTDPPEHTRDVLAIASRMATEHKLAKHGQRLIVVSGRPIGQPGHTNTLVVHTIGSSAH
jgi:pyruvate kinase